MDEIYETIIAHYGEKAQKQKAVEELQELICEVYNDLTGRGSRKGLITEIADVYNMLNQLCIIYDIRQEVEQEKVYKTVRTMARIGGDEW